MKNLIDQLERRQHFSITLDSGTVVIQGSSAADRIGVAQHPVYRNVLVADSGTEVKYFQLASVRKIEIFGLAGKDRITIDSSLLGLEIPVYANGGSGNDRITTLDGKDTLVGGNGSDILIAGDGTDLINGAKGNDVLIGGFGADLLYGGDGNDKLYSSIEKRINKKTNEGDSAFGEAGSDWFDPRTTWKKSDIALTANKNQQTNVLDYNAIIEKTLPPSSEAKVEYRDNDLVVSFSDTENQVKSGLVLLGGSGTEGIHSVEVDTQTIPGSMLAVVDDGDPVISGAITEISGFQIPDPTSSVLVKYTWFGDSNLDGVVDGSDYALIDTGFSAGGTLGGWVFGDYDYSGAISSDDLLPINTVAPTAVYFADKSCLIYDGYSPVNFWSAKSKSVLSNTSSPIDLGKDGSVLKNGILTLPKNWRLGKTEVRGDIVWYRVTSRKSDSVSWDTSNLTGQYQWLAVKKGTIIVTQGGKSPTYSEFSSLHQLLKSGANILIAGDPKIHTITDELSSNLLSKSKIPGILVSDGVIRLPSDSLPYFSKF